MDFPVGTYKIILLPHLFQKIGWDILFPFLFYPSFSPLTYILLSCMFKNLVTKECKFFSKLCGSRKYPYPPQGGSLEIPRRGGGVITKNFKGKYEAKLEFPEGCWGSNQKPSVGGVWKFSGTTQYFYFFFFQLVTFKLELKVNRWSDLNKRNKNSGQLLKLD